MNIDKNDGNDNLYLNKYKKEEKLHESKVEGDVNNGIEGRTKKEIQTEGVIERSHWIRENLHGS